ncbi:maternal effect protein staufen isoform X2 [Drosophila mauritiana]|uniref:Maternal effect protein staufen isoform X2 n=1 Tax=Drosophila mauritiana TaxID=7226 RepID=A0A6P8JMA9_DROMA|nr:maternal effect protein staufen isoform X2 [Drosophila mauritiana]
MQHNVHAARPAPHIRAAHHHSHSHSHAHMHLHPGMEQHLGPSLQQQQQPPPPPQQPPHRDHLHPRLNHHHIHAQQQQQTSSNQAAAVAAAGAAYHHGNINSNSSSNITSNSNQMQKIRQQHQHLNSSNGLLGNQPPGPPPQAFNPLAGNPAALAYNQLPPHPPHHMAAHLGSYAAPPPHYYMSQAKPAKYNHYGSNANSNSGSNNSNYAPKAILQNAYRNQKVVVPPVVQEVTPVPEPPVTTTNATTNNTSTVQASEPVTQEDTSQEPETRQEPASADDDASREHIDATGALSNEDTSSSGRGGKDKTPMCLVNELARYNKITHQYRLTGERGPAHCKTFTVTLMLGDEEYSADGFKIKKAQHLAASKAIEETMYKHPPPKIRRSEEGGPMRTHITPTVELNALAMKLGQRTFYLLDPTQIPPTDSIVPPEFAGGHLLTAPGPGMPQPPPPPAYALRQRLGNGFVPIPSQPMHPHFFHGPGQRPFPPKFPSRFGLPPPLGAHVHHGPNGPFPSVPTPPSKITLFVGKQKFVGIGRTLQQAKHDAAARALQVLKTQAISASEEALEDSMDEGDKKSPISQVHEIGIKRNMTVHFKVLREEGPAHMKNFITACIVGSIVTEGEGNGKKVSKKRAAEKMLVELQKLPPLTPTKQTPLKRIKVKTPGKSGAAAREGSVVSGTDGPTQTGKPERRKRLNPPKDKLIDMDDADNPITKLIQLQQTRKEKEPIFELIAKNGNETARRREFVMEVSASGSTARGTGNSKKLAKRNAAQALFELLEAVQITPTNETQSSEECSTSATMSAVTAPAVEATAEGEVPMVATPVGPMPGILILRQNKKPKKRDQVVIVKSNLESKEEEANKEVAVAAEENSNNSANSGDSSNSSDSQATEAASESALNTSTGSNTSGVSSNSSNLGANTEGNNHAESKNNTGNTSSNAESSSNSTSNTQSAGVHMKEQLLYLSKLLDFEVNFSDYPKGNHNEFLTIVTLSTHPPQICHGVGKSSEESQNDAASNALKILSKLGLNNAMK